jgi:DNA-binding transcriptional MerR regulator
MRIGELAEAVGVSTRAVRHYHRIGLLPEPPRRVNGYRTYGVRDVLRLARVRRLTELGLSLDEAADVLADDEGRELGEILAEIDADLARQEVEIRRRRERLAELLRRAADGPLDADDAVSVPTAELLHRMTAAFPGSDAARRDREFLALLDTSGAAALVAEQYREVLHDPEVVARTAELYRRFDELATRSVDDPDVTELARDFAAAVPTELVSGIDPSLDLDAHPFAAAFLRDLAPAQAEAVRRVYGIWSGR